jgi:hypothetical protein
MNFKLDDRPIRSASELGERLAAASEQVRRASALEEKAADKKVSPPRVRQGRQGRRGNSR